MPRTVEQRKYNREYQRARFASRSDVREKNRKCCARYDRTIAGRFGRLRRRAAAQGRDVSISRAEYAALVAQPCFYCGGPLPEIGYGLDRIDSSLGYAPGNVRPCCDICNKAKRDLPEDVFREWVRRIAAHWVGVE